MIAVNDGVVKKIGKSRKLGRFIVLQDVYGNRYTYAHLGQVSKRYPVPKSNSDDHQVRDEFRAARQSTDRGDELPKPSAPASAGSQRPSQRRQAASAGVYSRPERQLGHRSSTSTPHIEKERLFADPARPGNRATAEETGQLRSTRPASRSSRSTSRKVLRLKPSRVRLKTLKKGSKVIGGTVLGRIGKVEQGPGSKLGPHLNFSIRPAGRGAPRIDPKPILDGWKLLEATAIYRAAGRTRSSRTRGRHRPGPADVQGGARPAGCWPTRLRHLPVRAPRHPLGQIDRRVLATLEFLAASGLRPTVTSLKCGHGYSPPRATSPTTARATRSTSRRSTAPRSSVTRARHDHGDHAPQDSCTLQGPMQPARSSR